VVTVKDVAKEAGVSPMTVSNVINNHPNVRDQTREKVLEAMGRLLAGIAPWIESGGLELGPDSGAAPGEEGALRARYAELAREAIAAGTDPGSPDFMNFSEGRQPVVDAAFLALAIVRAPHELWKKLDARVQRNVIAALESTRKILPAYSNWLLFPATIEAALLKAGAPDPTPPGRTKSGHPPLEGEGKSAPALSSPFEGEVARRAGGGGSHRLVLPAYDQCIKASHAFNLLDARCVISVTERQSYILRVRNLAKGCGEAFLLTEAGGFGMDREAA